jgi:glycosyltransferase involved in cell wall biosynthesis
LESLVTTSSVIISNGFSKFPLAAAAAEICRRGRLAALFTGAYPTKSALKLLHALRLDRAAKITRLIARGEDIPDNFVIPFWLEEAEQVAAQILSKQDLIKKLGSSIDLAAHRHYGHRAAGILADYRNARIYHFRSCFGGSSIRRAKEFGMITVCDHSIANPEVLDYMCEHAGAYPIGTLPPISPFWSYCLQELKAADQMVVNSDFVRETFVRLGWDPARITSIYMGIDDLFLKAVPRREVELSGPIHLLFAGAFVKRKGAPILIDALQRVPEVQWRLDIVGSVDHDIRAQYASFFADPRVRTFGTLSRTEVATRMSQAEVFVFPSLAEGSARVIFEAMACGCFIVTTPNSGSIVQDGRHGSVVDVGSAEALAGAIRGAWTNRPALPQIGAANAELIRNRFRQRHYGDALEALYDQLIASSTTRNDHDPGGNRAGSAPKHG